MSDAEQLTLGLWQGDRPAGDVDHAIDQIETLCAQARTQSVDYLIFPECYLTGYYNDGPLASIAAQVTRDHLDRLTALTIRFDIGLQVGSYQAAKDHIFNAAHVFLPGQALIGSYRKRALYGVWEDEHFAKGNTTLVFSYRGFRIGVLICVEAEYPELSRDLAFQGVDLIAVSTALMSPYENVAQILIPARAMENRCFVGYANFCGMQGPVDFVGQSVICDPRGNILARGDEVSETMLTARLELGERLLARQDIDYLAELSDIAR